MTTNKKDLGMILIEADNSKKTSVFFKTAAKIYNNNKYSQVCVFNSYSSIIDNHGIPILHLNHAKFFNGKLLVFDINSLSIALECPRSSQVIFYAQNTPWVSSGLSYKEWDNIFRSKTEIIAANQSLYDIYEIMWKKPLGISENFDYDDIKELI